MSHEGYAKPQQAQAMGYSASPEPQAIPVAFDPMRMPIGDLAMSWRQFQARNNYLETEVSRLKLRIAELEHAKNMNRFG